MSAPYFTPDQHWLSDCCGAVSEGELYMWIEMEHGGRAYPAACGRCSKCHENTNFTRQETKTTTKG